MAATINPVAGAENFPAILTKRQAADYVQATPRYLERAIRGFTTYLAYARARSGVTIIEIRPFRNGWKCFEAPGVEPVFLDQEQAIDYAKGRACFRSGEIRIILGAFS